MKQTSAYLKLQSEEGITVLYALLLFLIAAVIACVILNAASTNIQVVHDDYAANQAQVSLDSAGKLVKKELTDFKIRVRTSGENTYFDARPAGSNSSGLRKLLQDAFKEVYLNSAHLYSPSKPYVSSTITLKPTEEKIQAVKAVLEVYPEVPETLADAPAKSFDVRVTISLQSKDSVYSEVVTMSQNVKTESDGRLFEWGTPEVNC